MPIYEYRCQPCESTFETLVRSSSDVPHCPKCGSIDLAKQFSVPASAKVSGTGSSSLPIRDSGPCGMGGCGSGMCAMD
ncbi:MAG: putative regulatory protein FmdB family [Planctomycetota bacterium]|nr:putative regulatory protein FmdB family [Planctomycetota bacterium]